MNHLKAFFIKFAVTFSILFLILGIYYQAFIGDVLAISFILSFVTYILGDLVILPKLGHLSAVFSDFGLAYIGIVTLGAAFIERPLIFGAVSFFAALAITVSEGFFHRYMTKSILPEMEQGQLMVEPRINFITEFAEELDVNSEVPKNKEEK
ncbi:hypothetical protein J2S74_000855 [Evansella vedderi]|uniref:DUF2512 family protein n=1 Tax=Evansella vedderi TaxID=38282 RepID=A0ABT9ZQH3_9BACI|nr:DUF2512 family protein [Evansella vedderi]MDQ0253483.1 hypothetical protein [Evansella vedderi]